MCIDPCGTGVLAKAGYGRNADIQGAPPVKESGREGDGVRMRGKAGKRGDAQEKRARAVTHR
ncbi:hypothetical protein GCM10010275_14510 [Streptomyces litmocidini]|nr:hypothetical protein GCM10010275_14510 [Streptomyces litmocidini]